MTPNAQQEGFTIEPSRVWHVLMAAASAPHYRGCQSAADLRVEFSLVFAEWLVVDAGGQDESQFS